MARPVENKYWCPGCGSHFATMGTLRKHLFQTGADYFMSKQASYFVREL